MTATSSPTKPAPTKHSPPRVEVKEPRIWLHITVIVILTLGAAYGLMELAKEELPVTDQDRAALPTAADVIRVWGGEPAEADAEKWTKIKGMDNLELTYKKLGPGLVILSEITVETESLGATAIYAGAKLGRSIHLGDIFSEERDGFFRWGGSSQCFLKRADDGAIVGVHFLGMQDLHVFRFIMSGIEIDKAGLDRVLRPYLDRILSYRGE